MRGVPGQAPARAADSQGPAPTGVAVDHGVPESGPVYCLRDPAAPPAEDALPPLRGFRTEGRIGRILDWT